MYKFLKRKTRDFIHTALCFPESMTRKKLYFYPLMHPSERCHVTLLAMCARQRAALLYGLRAVMEHHPLT